MKKMYTHFCVARHVSFSASFSLLSLLSPPTAAWCFSSLLLPLPLDLLVVVVVTSSRSRLLRRPCDGSNVLGDFGDLGDLGDLER